MRIIDRLTASVVVSILVVYAIRILFYILIGLLILAGYYIFETSGWWLV